jgi:nitroreductase
MDFLQLAAKRQSTRAYQNTPVPRETLARCLEAARLAPSAHNRQPWKFIVADDPAVVERLRTRITNEQISINTFIQNCPVIVAAVRELRPMAGSQRYSAWSMDFTPYDLGMAVENLCLAAADQGLGSCIIGVFEREPVKEILGIPQEKPLELLVALGFPAQGDPARVKKRLSLEEIVSFNRY